MHVATIGLDLAKSVFQVHGIDGEGRIVVRWRLRRSEMLPFLGALSRDDKPVEPEAGICPLGVVSNNARCSDRDPIQFHEGPQP